ncbi:hypothetical protein PHISP_05330 [Aspergillus sp. HF37]|nr:hypothetical protein PHISP_05330 [Aspergillus sp. HF37]
MDTNEHPDTQQPRLKLLQWHKLFDSDSPPRIGIEIRQRLPTTTIGSFSAGMAIGSAHGTKMAAYRFRAENAHRFPTSSKGWYQYHRNKNYAVIVGGVREGVKLGLKVGAAAMAFCLFEETADHVRNDRRDFLSTVTAGLSLSGIYSMLARHDVYTAARTTRFGLKFGLFYGLLQDAFESFKGNRPAYINFLLGSRRSEAQHGNAV